MWWVFGRRIRVLLVVPPAFRTSSPFRGLVTGGIGPRIKSKVIIKQLQYTIHRYGIYRAHMYMIVYVCMCIYIYIYTHMSIYIYIYISNIYIYILWSWERILGSEEYLESPTTSSPWNSFGRHMLLKLPNISSLDATTAQWIWRCWLFMTLSAYHGFKWWLLIVTNC